MTVAVQKRTICRQRLLTDGSNASAAAGGNGGVAGYQYQ